MKAKKKKKTTKVRDKEKESKERKEAECDATANSQQPTASAHRRHLRECTGERNSGTENAFTQLNSTQLTA